MTEGTFRGYLACPPAQHRTYFEDPRPSFGIKSGCSGLYPVKLQVSPTVEIPQPLWATSSNSLWKFSFPNSKWEFPALQLASVPSSCHRAPPKTIWLCLPYTLPADSNQGSLPSAFLSPALSSPAFAASPRTPCAPALTSTVARCWAWSSTSASLLYWGVPNRAQCSRCGLTSAKERGRIAALSSTPVLTGLQHDFMVLITTWWSCHLYLNLSKT